MTTSSLRAIAAVAGAPGQMPRADATAIKQSIPPAAIITAALLFAKREPWLA